MKPFTRTRAIALFTSTAFGLLCVATIRAQVAPPASQYSTLPSETPPKFNPVTDSFDYVKRTAMIPMRDGTKLFTVIVTLKGAKGYANHTQSSHLGPILSGPVDVIVEGGFIVIQWR